MVFWTQAARGSTPDIGFDFPVENPPGCTSPLNQDEEWVAATFWDYHDTHSDGDDSIWFTKVGAVPAIYLKAKMKPSMADFEKVYRIAGRC